MVVRDRPVTEGHILHDSICMKCPEAAKSGDKGDEWLPGAGGRGMGSGFLLTLINI